jgi:hypothetical protein
MHNIAPNAPGQYRELIWREEEILEDIQSGSGLHSASQDKFQINY